MTIGSMVYKVRRLEVNLQSLLTKRENCGWIMAVSN
jgi:hypothetical protein